MNTLPNNPHNKSKQVPIALATDGYCIRPGIIAGCILPLVILPMGRVENSDMNHWYMRDSDHQRDDWRFAVSCIFDGCALSTEEHEKFSLPQIGEHAHD